MNEKLYYREVDSNQWYCIDYERTPQGLCKALQNILLDGEGDADNAYTIISHVLEPDGIDRFLVGYYSFTDGIFRTEIDNITYGTFEKISAVRWAKEYLPSIEDIRKVRLPNGAIFDTRVARDYLDLL